jgi:hypothetical protein
MHRLFPRISSAKLSPSVRLASASRYKLLCFIYNVKPDFHREISVLREQAVDQWREFVATTVLADYQKGSRHVQSHSDCKNPTADSFTLSNRKLAQHHVSHLGPLCKHSCRCLRICSLWKHRRTLHDCRTPTSL